MYINVCEGLFVKLTETMSIWTKKNVRDRLDNTGR